MKKERLFSTVAAAVLSLCTVASPILSRTAGSISSAAEEISLGDVDSNTTIDSADASLILMEYSSVSTGKGSILTDAQRKSADVDKNGSVDSSDASFVLKYYSHIQTGGKLTFTQFLIDNKVIEPPVTTAAATTTTVKPTTVTTKATTAVTTALTTVTAKPTTAITTSAVKPTTITTKATTIATTTTAKPTTVTTTTTAKPTTVTTTTTAKPTTVTTTTTAKPTTVTTSTTAKPTTTTTKLTTRLATTAPETTTTQMPDDGHVHDIRITRTETTINVDESDWAAIVTMLPASAQNKGELWFSSDESVAVVDGEGWVTGIGEGKCVITVMSADNHDVTAEINLTVVDRKHVKSIRLSRNEMSMEKGTGELAARVTMLPETAVNKGEIWECSNEEIAVVDSEGWVIAKKAGNAIITVKSVENSSVYAMVLLTVTDGSTQPPAVSSTVTDAPVTETTVTTTVTTQKVNVSGISVNQPTVSMNIGEQLKPEVSIAPDNAANKKVSWKSSNSNIASVDENGNIHAVGKGQCIVTVSSVENSSVKTNIVVTVNSAGEVTDIVLSKYEMEINIGDRDIVWVTMFPSDAANQDELWTSSDLSIAKVDKYGWVTGVGVGECTVTVYSADSPNVKAEIKVRVVKENAQQVQIPDFSSIVPGKSTDKAIAFMTPIPASASGNYTIRYEITDANGKKTTINSPVIKAPVMNTVITMLSADTNEFTAEAHLVNNDNKNEALIGRYSFKLYPRDAVTSIEDVYYAFNFVG